MSPGFEPSGEIQRALEEGLAQIASADSTAALREAEVAALGRKAPLARVKANLADVPADERPEIGRLVNEARRTLEAALADRRAAIEDSEEAVALAGDRVDVTLPGRTRGPGHPHPVTVMMDRIIDAFVGLGYQVAEGPEVETDWFNFEALNMPPDHPARSLWDTLYVGSGEALLRTHTSPVQIRAMLAQPPPLFIVAPGRVYRRDEWTPRRAPVFHQVEGLAVDSGITFADLKGTLEEFATAIFGPAARLRFRPSYFPFTEPSAEIDVVCVRCEGAGCSACDRSGWIEILGAGMVHPSVFRAVGYDPRRVSGFAFGMGVERVAMRAWGITDIRSFSENDLRFLSQFSG